jgi:hypothetical protein
MAVYVMGYGIGRFWIEGLRIDPADEVAGLRWNQWVALAAIIGGAVALLLTWGQKWPDVPDVPDLPDLSEVSAPDEPSLPLEQTDRGSDVGEPGAARGVE